MVARLGAHRRRLSLLLLVALLGVATAIPYRAAGASTRNAAGRIGRFTPAIGHHPDVRPARTTSASGGDFACATTTPAHCLTPRMMRAAYGVDRLALDGAGRTIVIVDAYTSPTVRADLQTFDKIFGLPDPQFEQIAPDGLPPFDEYDTGQVDWSFEINYDVESAHAIAPAAKIVLVSARSDKDPDVRAALRYAVDHDLGDVISQSFYENEKCVSSGETQRLHQIYTKATQRGITVLASSGDDGAAAYVCQGEGFVTGVAEPASDPLVTGVGGTTLRVRGDTGEYLGESAWSGGGGGLSTTFAAPAFQSGLGFTGRAVPDISYEANSGTGGLFVWTVYGPGYDAVYVFGGTSLGSPNWAGLVALTDQRAHQRVGSINPALYALATNPTAYRSDFHDVKTGDNTNPYAPQIAGYHAHLGFDLATGLGSPRADQLVPALAGVRD